MRHWDDINIIFATVASLAAGFIAITFIQSGLDKATDYKGNLAWIKEQFEKTFLRGMIGVFLPVIMIGELVAGLGCVVGVIQLFWGKEYEILAYSLALSGIVLLMLLFGQRVSKQYAGAASLTGYFLITLLGLVTVALVNV